MCIFCLAPELSHGWKGMRELPAAGEHEVLACKRNKTRAIHIAELSAARYKLFVRRCQVWEG